MDEQNAEVHANRIAIVERGGTQRFLLPFFLIAGLLLISLLSFLFLFLNFRGSMDAPVPVNTAGLRNTPIGTDIDNGQGSRNVPQVLATRSLTPILPAAVSTQPVTAPTTDVVPTTARAAWDLYSLTFNAPLIAIAQVTGSKVSSDAIDLNLHVEEWLKKPEYATDPDLILRLRPQDWAAMPPSFQENAHRTGNRYFVFLGHGGITDNLPWYYMMGAVSGAYLIRDGRIADAPNPAYEGWSIEDFRRGIVANLPPTPTSYIPTPISTRAPGGAPVALARDGAGYRLDVFEGHAGFPSGPSPWVGSSRLLVEWSPLGVAGGVPQSTPYLIDVGSGKLEQLPGYSYGTQVFPQPAGKRLALVRSVEGDVTVSLVDLDTGTVEVHSIYSSDPSVPQWAGGDAHQWDIDGLRIHAIAEWLNDTAFVLRVQPIGDEQIRDWGTKLLLVDVLRERVVVLSGRGELAAVFPDGAVLWREGWWDGELLYLSPPYEGQPERVSAGGPWTLGWSVSPDGQKVAWLEMTPPSGDWSRRVPASCCNGEPPPVPQAIAVWDRRPVPSGMPTGSTGNVQRFPVAIFAWPRTGHGISWAGDTELKWRRDSATILYGTHPDDKSTALVEQRLDGQQAVLAEHNEYFGLRVLAEGSDGSVYYAGHNIGCEYCEQLLRSYPRGRWEVVLDKNHFVKWAVSAGRLQTLFDGGLRVQDLNSGDLDMVRFPRAHLTSAEMGWTGVEDLVPLSPDGRWAAYAGSNSDAVMVAPDGRAWDRGRFVLIQPVQSGAKK